MAIKKMSSQDYNNILKNATDKIEKISEEMNAVKNDMQKKVKIINYEQEYLSHLFEKNAYLSKEEDTFIFLNNKNNKGLYNVYSNVAHAYFKQTPINVFNLKVVNGNESFFRDEVKVTINEVEDDYFKNILKAETVKDKEIFFEEYEFEKAINVTEDITPIETVNNKSTIVMEVNKEKVIGTSKFNIIEIDPYLYKSFDIDSIEIYTDETDTPATTLNNLKNVGKTRFILDKKYEFKKVIFNLTHNYSTITNGKVIYPFGIKHIFFLEADFRNDSHVIINYSSEDYIDDIKDRVIVVTATGERISSLTEEGIRIFLSNNNGMLENEQEPSNDIKKPIARNIREVYFKVPLKNEAVIGYKFTINKR